MNGIVWFRKSLRIHDNPALHHAKNHLKNIYPIFILDPWFIRSGTVGPNRLRFLFECLQDLDSSLRSLNSRLLVFEGTPAEVLPRLIRKWDVQKLMFEKDTEPYAKRRDAEVKDTCSNLGVEVVALSGHTLYDPDKLLDFNRGQVPLSYQSFLKLLASVGDPAKVLPPIESLPVVPDIPGDGRSANGVPSLTDLGVGVGAEAESARLFPGGETAALERMGRYLAQKDRAGKFEKPKTSPTDFDPPSTTVLSPYLKFGCLSPRLFYWKLQELYRGVKGHSQPPVSLLGQLYWREFFYLCGHGVPNFDRMEGNRICRQIPWEDNDQFLTAWEQGRTGYPAVDAVMRQLHRWGWMHHLARHLVACFLTRGDLWVSWERGVAVFDRLLIDADWSLNNANWMWLSASAFFHQFFRVYSPIAFLKKSDPSGAFIRHFVPELSTFPSQYIYEPWNAPLTAQQKANCIIGKDYPLPIVDHEKVSKRNIERMKAAYAAGRPSTNDTGTTNQLDEQEEEVAAAQSKAKGRAKPTQSSGTSKPSKRPNRNSRG